MSTAKQQQQKLNQLYADLNSGTPSKVSAAFKALQIHGNAGTVPVVLEAWLNGMLKGQETEVHDFLIGIKDTSTIEPFMDAFRSAKFQSLQRDLVNVFWNSKLDFSAYLPDFILFAIEGDFMDCLEALTLIEQFEETIPESAILEAQILMKEYFGAPQDKTSQKYQLMEAILLRVRDIEEQEDMDDFLFDDAEELE